MPVAADSPPTFPAALGDDSSCGRTSFVARCVSPETEASRRRLTLVYAAIVFFAIFDLFMCHSSRMLGDPDTYWHIVTGDRILRTHALPVVDDYSYTLAGAPWIAKEWLSQAVFSLAYAKGGWIGVTALTAAVASLAASYLFAWLCRRLEPIVALTITTVTVSLGLQSLLARPQVFFYLLLTICACGLVEAVEKNKTPWWLAPLIALWANVHASFPIALALGALFGIEAVASAAPRERVQTAVKWGRVLLASLAATGLTPYGYEPLIVATRIVGAPETATLDEWRPMGFDSASAYGAAFIVGSFVIVAAARAGWTRAAPLLFCAALMVRHVRFFPLFGIVAAPALATPIARLFPRFARSPWAPGATAHWAAAAGLAASCVSTWLVLTLAPKPAPNPDFTAAAALEAARDLPVSGHVFNDYGFGGYLIFNGVKTFIDGRAELYFNGLFMETHDAEAATNDAAFLSLLDKYDVGWALLASHDMGAQKLRRSTNWKEIFTDDHSVVFVRK